MSLMRSYRSATIVVAALCWTAGRGAGPCLAQDGGSGPVTPDSADAIRRSLERPPPEPPSDLIDAVAVPVKIALLPVRFIGLGFAELVGLAVTPDPEPLPFVDALRDAGFRGAVGSIGPRSGVSAQLGFEGLAPFFIESAISIRGSQRHRVGLAFQDADNDQLELAYTFLRNNEPHFYGGIDSGRDARRVYQWDRQIVSVVAELRRSLREDAVVSLAARLGYEDNRVGRGQDRGTTPIQKDPATADLYGVTERVDYARAGATLGLDLRYNAGLQARGIYVEGGYDYFAGLGDTDSDFHRVSADMFGYLPINPRQQLAVRLLAEVNRSLGGRGVPFYHLAYLGSERGGRAYHQRRFQDLTMAATMVEWRWEVWRELHERSRVESFLFYDLGSVMPRLTDFRIGDARSSFGFGWRLSARDGALAASYIAFGDEGVRLRFTFSTAF